MTRSDVEYARAFAHGDLRYTSMPEGLKETIVLSGPPRSSVFSFDLDLTGLAPEIRSDGSIWLYGSASTTAPAYVIPAPKMWDAVPEAAGGPAVSQDLHYELTPSGRLWRLDIVADAGWLCDPARVYPVSIDPWVVRYMSDTVGPTMSSYTNSAAPTTNYYGVYEGSRIPIRAGYDGAYYRAHLAFSGMDATYAEWAASDIEVASADLSLNCCSNQWGTSTVKVGRITSPWNQSSLTWNNQPTSVDVLDKSITGIVWDTFDVTDIVRDWVGGADDHGIVIWGDSVVGHRVSFDGWGTTAYPDNWPHLTIRWTSRPHVTMTEPRSDVRVAAGAVPIRWTYSDFDQVFESTATSKPQESVQIQAGSNPAAPSLDMTFASSSTSSSLPATATSALPAGSRYWVRMRASGATTSAWSPTWSDWTPWTAFTIGPREEPTGGIEPYRAAEPLAGGASVDLGTGRLLIARTDLSGPGGAGPLAVGATYDSALTTADATSDLGKGWRISDPRLVTDDQCAPNTGFETAGSGGQPAAGWVVSNPAVTTRENTNSVGGYAYLINAGVTSMINASSTPTVTVWPGARILAGAKVRFENFTVNRGCVLKGGAVSVRFYSPSGSLVTSCVSESMVETNTPAGMWHDISVAATAPVTAASMSMTLEYRNAKGAMYVDDAYLKDGEVLFTDADGTSRRWEQTGEGSWRRDPLTGTQGLVVEQAARGVSVSSNATASIGVAGRSTDGIISGCAAISNYDAFTCSETQTNWLKYDLGAIRPVSRVDMYLWDGYELTAPRTYDYAIQAADKDVESAYRTVVARTTGRSWQHLSFPPLRARYLRVIGYDNSTPGNAQFHVCEFEVPVLKLADSPVVFDASGRIGAAADPDANISAFRRDVAGRLSSIEESTGAGAQESTRGIALAWSGSALSSLSWSGVSSTGTVLREPGVVTYASVGATITVARTEGARSVPAVRYGYDAAGRICRITDADGVTLDVAYDAQGRVASATQAGDDASSTTAFAYTSPGVVTVTSSGSDGTRVVRRVEFDTACGCQLTKVVVDPSGIGATTTLKRDLYGHIATATDPLGAVATTTCDAHGLPIRTETLAGSIVTTATYESDHLVTSCDAKGNLSATTYERPTWRVSSTAIAMADDDGDGKFTAKSAYDEWGNRTQGELGSPTSPNILENANFESSMVTASAGWTHSANAAWSDASALGQRELGGHYVTLAPTGGVHQWVASTETVVLKPGSVYAGSAWVAGTGRIAVRSVSATDTTLRETAVPFSGPLGVLRRVSMETTVPTSTASALLIIYSTTTQTAQADNARLEAANAAGADNLVENEGMELFSLTGAVGLPIGWTKRGTGTAEHSTCGMQPVSGRLCAEIHATQQADHSGDGYFYSSYMPVVPGSLYTAGAWVRTASVTTTDDGGVSVRVLYYDAAGTYRSQVSITPLIVGSQPFEHYLTQVSIPAGIASARMDLHVGGCTGAAYFDQVSFAAANPIEQTGYDTLTHSMAIEATSATGRRSFSEFDSRGRLLRSSYAANATTAPLELVQARSYDAAGRLARVDVPATSDSDLLSARFSYTDAGRVVSVIDPRGHETTMTYDSRGQLLFVTSPTGIVSQSSYDALGRLAATFRPQAGGAAATTLTTSAYDSAGRLTTSTILADDGATVALQTKTTYDKASRPTAVAISGESTASSAATYDAIGRVTAASADGPAGPVSTTAKYDANSNPTTTTWSWAGMSDTPILTWTKTDQLLASRALGRDWAYAYGSDGALASVAGTLSTRIISPDESGKTSLVRETATSAVGPVSIGAWQLGYDTHDRISQITRTGALGAVSETFTYDRADRLVSWSRGGSGVAYGYDADSDLISRGADTFAVDAEDRLVSSVISGVAHTYVSDEFGRRVSDAVAGSVVASLGWDAAGRLEAFSTPQTSATYRYGADGARALKVVVSSGATTSVRTIWSGTHPLAETLTSSGGVELRRYAYGPDGIPLALEVTSISGVKKTYAYVTDALGSVVALTDPAGSIVASYAYDPWGAPTGLGGSDLALASSQPLRYRGYYLDVESGLYHLPARVYDPATARFLSVDPAPPAAGSPLSLNAYAYCEGDPVGAEDPSGAVADWDGSGRVSVTNTKMWAGTHSGNGPLRKRWVREAGSAYREAVRARGLMLVAAVCARTAAGFARRVWVMESGARAASLAEWYADSASQMAASESAAGELRQVKTYQEVVSGVGVVLGVVGVGLACAAAAPVALTVGVAATSVAAAWSGYLLARWRMNVDASYTQSSANVELGSAILSTATLGMSGVASTAGPAAEVGIRSMDGIIGVTTLYGGSMGAWALSN